MDLTRRRQTTRRSIMPCKAIPASGRVAITLLIGVLLVTLIKDAGNSTLAGGPKLATFEADVQPIFQASCVRCHGERRSGDLDLRTFVGLMKGGESGPVVTPGKANKSLLYKKIHEG